jgi:exodeoxyribonuclease VII small subunit
MSASTPPSPLSFEQALARLEAVVHELEEGQIGLAEGLARYEEGIGLLRQCYSLLENAERRIELLSRVGMAGEAITEPFDESAQTLVEKTAERSKRRTRRPAAESSGPASSPSESEPPAGLF